MPSKIKDNDMPPNEDAPLVIHVIATVISTDPKTDPLLYRSREEKIEMFWDRVHGSMFYQLMLHLRGNKHKSIMQLLKLG